MDPVAICNMALHSFGANKIESINEDELDSQEAELCHTFFVPTFTQLLEEATPLFATGIVDLGARQDSDYSTLGIEHPFTAKFQFDLAKFVKPITCDDGSGAFSIQFERNENFIVCEETDKLFCKVVKLISDPAFWPPTFQWAVAYHLAAIIAGPITHSAAIVKEMQENAAHWYKKACNADGMQGTTNTQFKAGTTSLANRR